MTQALLIYHHPDFKPLSEASISVTDAGFLAGDGVYETLRTIAGKPIFLKSHVERLITSAMHLMIPVPLQESEFRVVIDRLLNDNQLEDAYVRVTLTRGSGRFGYGMGGSGDPTLVVMAKPFAEIPVSWYVDGISVHVAETRRLASPKTNVEIKALGNIYSLLAKAEAKRRGVNEMIMLNQHDEVCEGSAANIFWRRGETVYTPSLETGLLNGVTRQHVVRAAVDCGYTLAEGRFPLADVVSADEVLFTGTSIEVLPVTRIDEHPVGNGRPGPAALKLRNRLQEMVADDVSL